MKTLLNQSTLRKFLKLAGDHLKGEWILIGGTVLPALGIDHRSTVDIDLIGLSDNERVQTLALMELAEKLGLPIETINQAGDYFLQKISDFKEHLIPLHRGKTATIYRPDATLFLKLKLPRLSESDLADCLEFLKLSRANHEPIDRKSILTAIKKEQMKSSNSEQRTQRLDSLVKFLE